MFRTLPTLFILLAFTTFVQAQSLPAYLPHPSDLWVYLPMDSSLHDLVKGDTMGTVGTYTSAPNRIGEPGKALTSNDVTYASRKITYDTLRPSAAVTMAAWVRPTDMRAYSTVMSIRYNPSGPIYNTLFLGADMAQGKWTAQLSTSQCTDTALLGPAYQLNTWTHLAMTYSVTEGKAKLFVNGIEVASLAVNGNLKYYTSLHNFLTVNGADGASQHGFVGDIDDAVIYDRDLIGPEIVQVMRQGQPGEDVRDGLLLHYAFNGDVLDSTANNRDGTLNGGGTSYVAGWDGSPASALLLNETPNGNAYVSMPSLTFSGKEYSVAAWVRKTPSIYGWTNDCALFHLGTAENTNEDRIAYGLSYGTGGGAYVAHAYDTRIYPVVHPTSEWFHVVLAQKNGKVNIYQNGVNMLNDNQVILAMTTVTRAFNWIGKTHFGAYANITIDDFRLYDRAISESEAATLYSGQKVTSGGVKADPATLSTSVRLFPNPTADFVTVETTLPVQEVRLLDLTGKTVLTTTGTTLEVAGLPAGMYLVQVQTAQGIVTERLLVE